MKKEVFFILILITLFLALNYSWMDALVVDFLQDENELANVSRIVDGDTLKLENGETVRLLGVNTPERGERYYQEAKEFLQLKIEGKEVRMERTSEYKDKYGRLLRHVFLAEEHINIEIIEEGYANPYFLQDKRYEREFRNAWNKCIQRDLRLCEKSRDPCAPCIKLEEFDYQNQKFTLRNVCSFSCDLHNWEVKEEGRKHFSLSFAIEANKAVDILCGEGKDTQDSIFLDSCENIWTATGDTIYIRDGQGNLVLWKSY
jgi:micrococcal nuclease